MTQALDKQQPRCKYCAKPIVGRRADAKYCSDECKNAYNSKKLQNKNKSELHPLKDFVAINPENPLDYLYSDPLMEMHQYFAQPGIIFEKFSPKQEQFFLDFVNEDIPVMIGIANRGFAKTYLAAIGNLYLIQKHAHEGWHAPILSGSKKQSQAVYKYISYGLENIHLDLVVGKVKRLDCKLINDGVVDCLLASETSTRCGRANILTNDEFCQTPNDVIDSSFGQIITSKKVMIRFIGTPDNFGSLVKTFWDEADELGIHLFHADDTDCPHLQAESVQIIAKLLKRTNPDKYLIEVKGLWRAATGNIFSQELIESATVDNYPPIKKKDFERFVMGVDIGTVHLSVIIVLGLHKGIWYVLECEGFNRQSHKKPITHLENRVLYYYNKYPGIEVKIEESTSSLYLIEVLTKKIKIKEDNRIRFPNDKSPYADKVRLQMEEKRLKIHKTFKDLLLQLYELHYDKNEKIAKVKDDYVDALFYANGMDIEKHRNFLPFLPFEQAGGSSPEHNVFFG